MDHQQDSIYNNVHWKLQQTKLLLLFTIYLLVNYRVHIPKHKSCGLMIFFFNNLQICSRKLMTTNVEDDDELISTSCPLIAKSWEFLLGLFWSENRNLHKYILHKI